MDTKKTIVVFGATGSQGGGLARAILSDNKSEFAVRAVTRDSSSDKARELSEMGAEVVTADIDDSGSAPMESSERGKVCLAKPLVWPANS